MHNKVLRTKIKKGALKLVEHDGRETIYGRGEPDATWRMHDPQTLRRIMRNPLLNLGETYMDQEWDVDDNRLVELINTLRQDCEPGYIQTGPLAWYEALLRSWNNVTTSLHNVSHHYDLDESLFRRFLDRDMHYSCGYFKDPDLSLESAQLAKCHHIRKKLCLEPGQKVLDIGCGWGSLAMHLAEHADVEVVGVTLSREQLRVARSEARRRGLDDRVVFRLEDYRHHEGQYDAIVSVGMFEHVGRRNFQRYFQKVKALLKDDGVALIHTIGLYDHPKPTNPWILRHIFPGGYIPALSEMTRAVERTRLVTSDVEVWRRHYALTLKEWNRRFQAVRADVAREKGERFCRMWEFYLTSCQSAFEVASLVVFQLQVGKVNDSVPLTRDYLHRSESEELPASPYPATAKQRDP